MSKYRRKQVAVEASQWWKDGDHASVIPRPAVVRFDRAGHYFYVDHAEPQEADMRPTAWLAVDRDGEIAKKNGEALPFAYYEVKSGEEVRIAERPDLLAIYMADHKWARAPRDFGILETQPNNERDIVAPGDWIVREADGSLHVCSPADFTAIYESVIASPPSSSLPPK